MPTERARPKPAMADNERWNPGDIKDLAKQKQVLFDSIVKEYHREPEITEVIGRVLEHDIDDGVALMQRVGMTPEGMQNLFNDPRFYLKHPKFKTALDKHYHTITKEDDFLPVVPWGSSRDYGYRPHADVARQLFWKVDSLYGHAVGAHILGTKNTDKWIRFEDGSPDRENATLSGAEQAEMLLKQMQLALEEQVYAAEGRNIVLEAVKPYFVAKKIKPRNEKSYTVEDLREFVGTAKGAIADEGSAIFNYDFLGPDLIERAIKNFGVEYDPEELHKKLKKNRYKIAEPIYRAERRSATKALIKKITERLSNGGIVATVDWNDATKKYEINKKDAPKPVEKSTAATNEVRAFDLERCEKAGRPLDEDKQRVKESLDLTATGINLNSFGGMSYFDWSGRSAGPFDHYGAPEGRSYMGAYCINGRVAQADRWYEGENKNNFVLTYTGEDGTSKTAVYDSDTEFKKGLDKLRATRPGAPLTEEDIWTGDPRFNLEKGHVFIGGVNFGRLNTDVNIFKNNGRYFISRAITVVAKNRPAPLNGTISELMSDGTERPLLPRNTFDWLATMYNITDTYMAVGGVKKGEYVIYRQPLDKKGIPASIEAVAGDSVNQKIEQFDFAKAEKSVREVGLLGGSRLYVVEALDMQASGNKNIDDFAGATSSFKGKLFGPYDALNSGDDGHTFVGMFMINGQPARVHEWPGGKFKLSYFDLKKICEKDFVSREALDKGLEEFGATRPGAPLTWEQLDSDHTFPFLKTIRASSNEKMINLYEGPGDKLPEDKVSGGNPYYYFNAFSDVSIFKIKDRYFYSNQHGGVWEKIRGEEKGVEIVPDHTFVGKATMFNITDDYIVVGGSMVDGEYVIYRQPTPKKDTEDTDPYIEWTLNYTNKSEEMRLLNGINQEEVTLQEVNDLLAKIPSKQPTLKKEIEQKGRKVFDLLTKALKHNPPAFADTIPATRDVEPTDAQAKYILGLLHPELKKILEKEERERQRQARGSIFDRLARLLKGGGEAAQGGARSAGDYLRKHSADSLTGADPESAINKKLEIMRTREVFKRLVVMGHYGSYTAGQWHEAPYGLPSDVGEPSHECTATVPVQGLSEVVLPTMLGARIIPERIKGVTEKGKEIPLTVRTNAAGIHSVDVDAKLGLKEVVYSQSVSDLPAALEKISHKEYELFARQFVKQHGAEVRSKIAPALPPEMKAFIASLANKFPEEKVIAVEAYVRDIAYYDFSNGESMGQNRGDKIEDRLQFMRNRVNQLKQRQSKLAGLQTKQYAGVCADFAVLTSALLREAGFVSGTASAFWPDSTSITAADAHAVATVPWPSNSVPEGFVVVPVDGTPGGVTAEEKKKLAAVQLPSLAENAAVVEKAEKEEVKQAEVKLSNIEAALATQDPVAISKLSNGDLESTLNVILEKTVTKSHVDAIEGVLNTIWYSPLNVRTLNVRDHNDQIALLKFMEPFFTVHRQAEKSDVRAKLRDGSRLLKTVAEFGRRMANESTIGSKAEAYELLEGVFKLASKHLTDVEKRAAAVTVAYLRAKQMVKKK